ncbi:hypothetical protein ACK11Z_12875 [Methanoculleus bourgensis]|uniref:hypothetical protein n=1 Tax=Methanoculleus bourgensis TaxID=83986 RepID=UPI003B945105
MNICTVSASGDTFNPVTDLRRYKDDNRAKKMERVISVPNNGCFKISDLSPGSSGTWWLFTAGKRVSPSPHKPDPGHDGTEQNRGGSRSPNQGSLRGNLGEIPVGEPHSGLSLWGSQSGPKKPEKPQKNPP